VWGGKKTKGAFGYLTGSMRTWKKKDESLKLLGHESFYRKELLGQTGNPELNARTIKQHGGMEV